MNVRRAPASFAAAHSYSTEHLEEDSKCEDCVEVFRGRIFPAVKATRPVERKPRSEVSIARRRKKMLHSGGGQHPGMIALRSSFAKMRAVKVPGIAFREAIGERTVIRRRGRQPVPCCTGTHGTYFPHASTNGRASADTRRPARRVGGRKRSERGGYIRLQSFSCSV
jgi:hypothetical protein